MRERLKIINTEIFQILLITYITLLIVENIKEGFVTYFFNLNILLAGMITSGIIMTLTSPKDSLKSYKKIAKRDIIFISLLTLGASTLLFYKTIYLGLTSILVSLLAAIIIILVSYLILTDKQ